MNKLHRGDLHYTKATVALLLHSISNHAVMGFFFPTFDASAGSLSLIVPAGLEERADKCPCWCGRFFLISFFFFFTGLIVLA